LNKSNHFFSLIFCAVFFDLILSQEPFLEIRPYVTPDYEQYPASAHVDHNYPTQTPNGIFSRFDGKSFDEDIIAFDCTNGFSCYDGHAGVDYYMPVNTPILAPAPGYVVWSSFSAGADPCPGGIDPNGDTGIIIVAHGNNYFSCYLHLNPPLNVSVGETVNTGDTLGFEGMTGCADQPHLHFEIRKDSYVFDQEIPWAIDPFGWWGDSDDPIKGLRGNRSVWLWKSSDMVDDGDNGFQRNFGPYWQRLETGYNQDCWSAPLVNSFEESRHYAIWVPELADSGEYNIGVFIPEGFDAASGAVYEIFVQDDNGNNEKTVITYDQTSNPGTFATIATMNFPTGHRCGVILRDVVDSSSSGSVVVFDAIRFTNTSTVEVLKEKNNHFDRETIDSYFAYPNPFNPFTIIKYKLSVASDVSIGIFNVFGNRIKSFTKVNQAVGEHFLRWDADNDHSRKVPTGIYFYSIKAGDFTQTKKMLFIK
jgi:hypothetical protein